MSELTVKGKVVANLGVQSGMTRSGKSWSKATIVIETDDQYPKKIAMDHMKEAEKFASLTIGATGVFHIEVSSREYNERWFTSVNCWKWETDQPAVATQPQPQQARQVQPQPTQPLMPAQENDLPF